PGVRGHGELRRWRRGAGRAPPAARRRVAGDGGRRASPRRRRSDAGPARRPEGEAGWRAVVVAAAAAPRRRRRGGRAVAACHGGTCRLARAARRARRAPACASSRPGRDRVRDPDARAAEAGGRNPRRGLRGLPRRTRRRHAVAGSRPPGAGRLDAPRRVRGAPLPRRARQSRHRISQPLQRPGARRAVGLVREWRQVNCPPVTPPRPILQVFGNRRIAAMLLLGFASGLPLALSAGTLQAWLTVEGLDIRTIGFFALAGLPYTFKFAWAPLADRFEPPLIGRRRSWLVVTQLGLAALCFVMATLDPKASVAAV